MKSPLIDNLENMGLSVSQKGKTVTIQGPIASALAYAQSIQDCSFAHDGNRYDAHDRLTDDKDPIWTGGLFSELTASLRGELDLKPFEKARAKLEKDGLVARVQEKIIETIPKRRRRFSDTDGEWDYDRRWEIDPYLTSEKRASPGAIVDLNCYFATHGGRNGAYIDRFGATVWAIADLLENAGVRTRIVYHKRNEMISSANDGYVSDIRLVVKEAGEYVSPSFLAAAFTSNFYRRIMFSMIIAAADCGNQPACSSLGQAKGYSRPIEFVNGALNVSSELEKASFDEIEREIIKAIENKNIDSIAA
jgi:hypothetical protein